MKLDKKKALAAKVLKVGKGRILLVPSRFEEIKEAITKQDIKDLHAQGAIKIREIKGRKTVVRKKRKKGPGKVRKRVNKRKQEYVKITRKLRRYVKELKNQDIISNEDYRRLREEIKSRTFRSKAHLKEQLALK